MRARVIRNSLSRTHSLSRGSLSLRADHSRKNVQENKMKAQSVEMDRTKRYIAMDREKDVHADIDVRYSPKNMESARELR